jgi:hypothetical protein
LGEAAWRAGHEFVEAGGLALRLRLGLLGLDERVAVARL